MADWGVPGYTDVRELGAGAAGRVVLAVHDATGLRVAVKYLGDELRRAPAFLAGFRAEARLLGALETPYVVRLYEYVEAPEGAAIVMELVDGLALRALLREYGPVGPEAALTVLKGSLLGLAAAHAGGVVHRDYKPENVLVSADGASRLVDFGIATGRGTVARVAGTPAYMAPEQWTGAPASPASDVYAATATFYECLTGRKPFTGENIAELALRHVEAPVPEDDVPEPLRPLVRHGLAKAPEERPQEAAAFVRRLEEIATAAYGPRWEERGRGRLASLAALLPLLFPSSGDRAGTTTALAETALPEPPGWRAWLPDPLGWGAICAGLLLVIALGVTGTPMGLAGPGASAASSAGPSATTDVREDGAVSVAVPSTSATASPTGPGAEPPKAPSSAPATPSPDASGDASSAPAPADPASASPPLPGGGTTTPPPTATTPAATPTTAPPSPAATGPSPTPTVAAAAVKAVTVTDFRQTGTTTATATFEITTDGPGPVVLGVRWYAGDSRATTGAQDGATETYRRSGATSYTVTLTHTFSATACYWTVTATSDPAPAGGGASRRLLTRGCELR
ncbi:serine/threonine-protein kinase [Streptomyces thermolilacinus]|uniref:non-specific serine/threonine protein kinase n=1 Tax=Streptomyces thermolilacinus SPC6 TaxID=1306406 RepID=A0A1D3DYS4_9ACTN|nr:serine/threonine-protein kinase [Streptomyces thermolilacinus]OEJ97481.1 serine/threonine protein kinase [Streptomyces thermolilacinus SPC6]